MSILDPYIFDSQFVFLSDQNVLKENFQKEVLLKLSLFQRDNSKAYFRNEIWDSEKFGKAFGRVIWLENNATDSFYDALKEDLRNYDCTYIRVNSAHQFCKWAKAKKLAILSSKISQHLDLHAYDFKFSEVTNYKEWTLSDHKINSEILKQVIEISQHAFGHNRFKKDEHFTAEMIQSIYGQWAEQEFLSGNSKLYLILEKDKVASFFLYRENISPAPETKIGFVSLIASSPQFKEKQFASHLLNFVLSKAKGNNTDYVLANTESENSAALNFFKKNKFIVTSSLNEYHLWN